MTNTTTSQRWFRPPRPHGDLIEDRSVGFLELFYDLVFVVLIAQLAHTLATHATWTGVRGFVVVFPSCGSHASTAPLPRPPRLLVAAIRPAPWLLAPTLWVLLSTAWLVAFLWHSRLGHTITDRL